MRDYVERLEAAEREMPEGQEATYEDVMESYYQDVDTASNTDKPELDNYQTKVL